MYMPKHCVKAQEYTLIQQNLQTTEFRLFGERHRTIPRSSTVGKFIMQTRCIFKHLLKMSRQVPSHKAPQENCRRVPPLCSLSMHGHVNGVEASCTTPGLAWPTHGRQHFLKHSLT